MAKKKATVETEQETTALSKTAQAEVALANVREVSVTPEAPIKFVGNYAEVLADINTTLGKYKTLKIKDSNFAEAELAKKMCQTLRTSVTNRMKEWKAQYITLPSDTEQAKFEKLLSVIKEVESGLDKQFEVFEGEKRDALTIVLNQYVDAALEANGFDRENEDDEAYIAQIELKSKYYNKTQKEADSKADIEEQVRLIKKEKDEYIGTVNIIKNMCAEDERLDVATYIDNLKFQSPSVVMQSIIDAKERLKTVQVGAKNEKVVAGLSIGLSPKGKKAGAEVKEMRVKITYPASSGAKLKKFFDDNPEIKVMTIV